MTSRSGSLPRALAWVVLALLLGASPAASPAPDPDAPEVDLAVVEKEARKLTLYSGETVVEEYAIALGGNPTGHKQQEGDRRTPEGGYTIDYRNPKSRFFLSLHISYPNEADRRSARERGVSPGGDIFIHGLGREFSFLGKLHALHDWIDGCIAVTNEEIQEIWDLVPNGTRIRLLP